MARYSGQFWSNVLQKLLSPQNRMVGEVAGEFTTTTVAILGRKARINDGTLEVNDGAKGPRHRQSAE